MILLIHEDVSEIQHQLKIQNLSVNWKWKEFPNLMNFVLGFF